MRLGTLLLIGAASLTVVGPAKLGPIGLDANALGDQLGSGTTRPRILE
jgi:hypothetical protein